MFAVFLFAFIFAIYQLLFYNISNEGDLKVNFLAHQITLMLL